MADDTESLSKAFKILNIRRRTWRGERPHLLGLPQELRDAIYEMVLVEPPLYLREHKAGCPRINKLHGAETAICKSSVEEYERGYGPLKDCHKYVACQRICQDRPGLALLRVSRQLYEEARPFFYSKNIFCFMSVAAFNKTLPKISQSTLGLIRRLEIMNDHMLPDRWPYIFSGRISVADEDELWENVLTLPGIISLSLPAHILIWCYDGYLRGIATLQHLRATHFTYVRGWYENGWPGSTGSGPEETVYMLLHQDLDLPACPSRNTHGEEKSCWRCRHELFQQYRDLRSHFYNDIGGSYSGRPATLAERCSTAGREWVRSSEAVSPDGRPLAVTLQLDEGTAQEVIMLGLPRLDDEAREHLEDEQKLRARRARASNARKVRSQPSVAGVEEQYTVERVPTKRTSFKSLQKQARGSPAERSREEIAHGRVARLRDLAKTEKLLHRAVAERAHALRAKSMEATVASKKRARKRCS